MPHALSMLRGDGCLHENQWPGKCGLVIVHVQKASVWRIRAPYDAWILFGTDSQDPY